jgi:cytoskeletal protein CcmA (bactofilin family)
MVSVREMSMVFNRKPEPVPAEVPAPQLRRLDRNIGVEKQHLHAVASAGPDTQSVIGNDLSIEGQTITIRCKGSLKVLGNIQADLHSRQLEVGKEAVIQGAIAAETVDVFGRVSGAIMGAHVVLHAGAEVDGDIHSHLLSIEQGAVFDGRSRRVRDPAEIAPQLERSPGSEATNQSSAGPQPYATQTYQPPLAG